jgi:hypothetical protein
MRTFVIPWIAIVVVVALPLLAQNEQRPLIDTVTVLEPDTVILEFQEEGLVRIDAAGNASRVTTSTCILPDDPAKPTVRTNAPAVIFKNGTQREWTIRVVPQGAEEKKRSACHTVQCARTLQDLQDMKLCELSPPGSDRCIMSQAAVGRCFGPECTAIREQCQLSGKLDGRTCDVAVAAIVTACNSAWCGTSQHLRADRPEPGLDSVVFPREAVGTPPHRFFLERDDGTFRPLEITVGGDCPTFQRSSNEISEVAVVPLDQTGVGSWVYLNPMNPACLACNGERLRPLAFDNRTSDRAFSVSIEFPADVSPALAAEGCEPNKPCKISRTILPNNSTVFTTDILSRVPAKTLLKFQVSFYDETEKPSNPFAYLRVSRDVDDPSSQLATTFATKLAGQLDPFIPAVPEKLIDENADGRDDATGFLPCYPLPTLADYKKDAEPALCAGNRIYDGDYTRRYTGLVRVDLAKPLGRRADISASVSYRSSDFGVDDGNVAKLSDYNVNVYASNAIFARFGRTTWANPSNGIAVLEKGDGFRVAYKNVSLAHIIKRESAKALADDDNRDSKSIVAQLKALPLGRWRNRPIQVPFFRGLKLLDVTLVRGEDRASHVYTTVGGEVFYTFRNPTNRPRLGTLSGSVAGYRSLRDATTTTIVGPRHAEGWVGLLTTTWIPKTRSAAGGGFEATRSYTLQVGRGSSDDPKTPDRAEDYIGEGGAFSADTIFMATFAGKIDAKGHVIVGPSLANKRYLGLQIVDNTWSPLEELAKLLKASDVNSRSTTFRIRNYTFGRPVFQSTTSRDAVTEYSLEFAVEVPKGVRISIGTGYMHTGHGIESVIDNDGWVFSSGVSLTL